MTDKSTFTPEEWKLLLESAMMAGIAVTPAEPSGLCGLLRESFASGSALMQAKLDPGSNPLINRCDEWAGRRVTWCQPGQAQAAGQRHPGSASEGCGGDDRPHPDRPG